jgi:hypothetical protein
VQVVIGVVVGGDWRSISSLIQYCVPRTFPDVDLIQPVDSIGSVEVGGRGPGVQAVGFKRET